MAEAYVIGIDQSTQSTKALLFDERGRLAAAASRPHQQIINDKGFVEHDLKEILNNVGLSCRELLTKVPDAASKVAAVGLSVQRETVAAWQHSTLEPLGHAIVWQCGRAAGIVARPEINAKRKLIRERTGLELSEFFSAAKLTWMSENWPAFNQLAAKDDLCVGNMDAFLIAHLTLEHIFATEPSNASRTQLMNLDTAQWDEDLCRLFEIPLHALPPILDSDSLFGTTDLLGALPKAVPLHAAIGDSQGALFGEGCLSPGLTKVTYGTGSSVMMNAGSTRPQCLPGVVASAGWRRQGKLAYVLEGNINYSAAIISWLKDDLKLISSPSECEALARAANPLDETCIVPAFSGLGAPYFCAKVRGTIVGMSRTTGRNELVKAALEAIVCQVGEVVELIDKSAPGKLKALCADGGAARNALLMQLQSDLSRLPVTVQDNAEVSGAGAAYLAGLAAGVMDEQILLQQKVAASYSPEVDAEESQRRLQRWRKAVQTALFQGA